MSTYLTKLGVLHAGIKIAVVLSAFALTACSADLSRLTYVGQRPAAVYNNNDVVTGSVNNRDYVTPVQSAPLAPTYAQPQYPQPTYAQVQPRLPVTPRSRTPTIVAANGQPSSLPPSYAKPQSTYPAPNTPAIATAAPRANIGWTAAGGSLISVQPGQTTSSIAQQNGIPEDALLQVNGLPAHTQLRPGTQVVIPVYNGALANSRVASVAAPSPYRAYAQAQAGQVPSQVAYVVPPPPQARPYAPQPIAPAITGAVPPAASKVFAGSYVVQSGDTLGTLARSFKVRVSDLAAVNGLRPNENVRVGQTLNIPQRGVTVVQAPANAVQPPQVRAAAYAPPADPVQTSSVRPRVATVPTEETVSGQQPSFRWPVKGSVIGSFGNRANGERNDGIDIDAPAGTVIRAAEAGEVVYASNGLSGYGNLVLIKHAGGFVTAYAHADELLVHRGDTVSRGQSIATVGMTGTVNRPQLHFEIRAASKPVNPVPYLNG